MMGNWSGMMEYGFGHWVWFATAAILFLYPIGRILSRIGFSPLWSIVAAIPVLNLIALWVVAFVDWPPSGGAGSMPPTTRALR